MTNHVKRERNDGNGFSGGLRLSWAALAVLVSTAALSFVIANTVHSRSAQALERVEVKIDNLDAKLDATVLQLTGHCANPNAHHMPTGP